MLPNRCAATVFLAALTGWSLAGAHAPDVDAGLKALRAGHFEEAERRFARLAAESPDAPEGPFFQAFEMWWKLLDRSREREQMRLEMEERLEEAARRARVLQESSSDSDRQRGLVFFGVARLLDAQSKAVRGAHMGASGSARQGHKALSQVLEKNPDAAEALFAMGAYNYFADNLPALVKGIRFLLFIPGGDRERGIAQLERAAASSRLFGTESLMLLGHIFSNGGEDDYARALRYLEEASSREPSSPLITLVRADLLFNAGFLAAARDLSVEVGRSLENEQGYLRDLRRYAAFREASCTLRLHDPLGALHQVEAALEALPPETRQEQRRWLVLLASAAREAGQPERVEPWIRRLAADRESADAARRRIRGPKADTAGRAHALQAAAEGRRTEALRRLEDMLDRDPQDTVVRYHVGRLLQAQGRLDEARPHLEAAAHAGPPELAGWAWIRMGWQEDREQRRNAAVEYYRRASRLKHFTFQPAARIRLERPRPEPPDA